MISPVPCRVVLDVDLFSFVSVSQPDLSPILGPLSPPTGLLLFAQH